MGVPLAMVGTYILIARIVDVFTDPLMGYISDHTNSRFGRRKPWIVLSVPLLMISVYFLFMPPEQVDGSYLLLWMIVMGLGTTMAIIPYYAWGAELTDDYNERSKVTGFRAGAGIIGMLSAQLIPAAALFFFGIGGSATVLELVGYAMLILMPICVLGTVLMTPEPEVKSESRVSLIAGLKLMVTNGPFLRLIFGLFVNLAEK